MKKSNIRRWLHLALDFLPLFVIPVFMVYSHRHTINDYTVVHSESEYIDMYQYVINGVPTGSDNIIGYIDEWADGYANFDLYDITKIGFNTNCRVSNGSYYYFSFETEDQFNNELLYISNTNDSIDDNIRLNSSGKYSVMGYYDGSTFDVGYITLEFQNYQDIDYFAIRYVQFFNVTEIFGVGNEPTKEVFESYLTSSYYEHGNHSIDIGHQDILYNDTDIGSQFVYSLYNVSHKYFNMDNVINLGNIYNWFETNLFGGNVPIGIHAVWHIISYEFVMDIIFLVYSVFMFIIDFTEKFLSSMYDKSFGGGR